MRIASTLENQKLEKRVAITPEIAKKYISLGIDVSLSENYASHLGINDEEYKELGVSILKDEKEIISNANIIVQLGLLDDDKSSLLKENQTYIGVLNGIGYCPFAIITMNNLLLKIFDDVKINISH
jgi:NAD(P) transhydrogenase subunit alpha